MIAMYDFIDPRTADFIGLARTLEAIRPSSEAARRKLANPDIFGPDDAEALALHHARVHETITILSGQPERVDHLRHHLRQLPWLGDVWEQGWGQAELALLHLFRYHAHRLAERLKASPVLADWCALPDMAELDAGALGEPGRRAFTLEDLDEPELAAVRDRLRVLTTQLREEEEALREQIADDYDLSTDSPQWVIDRSDRELHERMAEDERLVVTAESIASVRFAPRPTKRLMAIRRDMDAVLIQERALENAIFARIEQALRPRQDIWRQVERRLVRLDLLIAIAQRALDTRAVAPQIGNDPGSALFHVVTGCHEGLRRRLEDSQQDYTPLTLTLTGPLATLTGANMGGKTVVLQTVGWLQTMTQLGFFVPAARFQTRLYRRVAALSTYQETLGGLSGFGREIQRLKEILPWRAEPVLYLIDEPGRTTHVEEGRALTRAVLECIAQSPSVALVSTHLDGLDAPGILRLRMGGLRHEQLADWRAAPEEQRAPLHHLMCYTVDVASEDSPQTSDALDVAELLGLDPRLVARARTLMTPDCE